ncbi:hypothetical protein Anas_03936 [Armadillidium nasatum]|uniref:Uncharacterized protein n=1 Tax=Armadillidium nasatum TaxID=96803 RepID=A0A5N5SRX8_9CRUS|nr:hypothetical protein Anas_03936 [Armadillidium nasatum]
MTKENPRINDVNCLSCNLGKSESSEQDFQMADSLNGERFNLPDEELQQIEENTQTEVVPKPRGEI